MTGGASDDSTFDAALGFGRTGKSEGENHTG
jgi:hypothetical protein